MSNQCMIYAFGLQVHQRYMPQLAKIIVRANELLLVFNECRSPLQSWERLQHPASLHGSPLHTDQLISENNELGLSVWHYPKFVNGVQYITDKFMVLNGIEN